MNQDTQTHVVVIGAGLAGLGAAYELSKRSDVRVTVIEARDRVGGRVHSVEVQGQPVDFGGFIIYPWYQNYLRIMQELRMENQLEEIPLGEIYYKIDDTGNLYTNANVPFSKLETLRLTLNMSKSVLVANDVANPPLDNFNHMTASEYFRSVLDKADHAGLYETYTDTVTQGYCYAPASQFRMSFMVPFIRMSRFQGDVKDSYFIRGGNNIVPQALAREIERIKGNQIMLNSCVTRITEQEVYVGEKAILYDKLITAQNVDHLYKDILPGVSTVDDYTHFYTLTLRFNNTPAVAYSADGNTDDTWGAVFYEPNNTTAQITSSINLATLYNESLAGYVNINVVIRDGEHKAAWSNEQAYEAVKQEVAMLFPNVDFEAVEEVVHWPKTMPVMTEDFVSQVRAAQGKNNVYFAGDFLGAPSMEAALSTGVRAAEHLLSDLDA